MTEFNIAATPFSTVLYMHSEKDSLQLDPDYQRQSEIWSIEKRQLLIDSIINGYDIPKIYFHKFRRPKTIGGKKYSHAIIDGKQRLSSIWGFIDGSFRLGDDVEYISDSSLNLGGLSYAELGKNHPKLKLKFDSYPLSIVSIETDDLDLIEDMFSRLNEAVPLSAAEKRNAFGGPMPKVIRHLATTTFCRQKLPFGNRRYRHFDILAKFLITEDKDMIVDTKKIHLDEFVRRWRPKRQASADALGESTRDVLAHMSAVFKKSDPLLQSVGTILIYYHVFRIALIDGWHKDITRSKLLAFETSRKENRLIAEEDISKANFDLIEYDRYVQTPNDSYAIAFRLNILLDMVFNRELLEDYWTGARP